MKKTKEDRINTVYSGGGHVVILGAGASIASTLRNPEINGKKLPSMDNFIDIVGLRDIVEGLPKKLQVQNFETLYSSLHKSNPKSKEIIEIESRVYSYFVDMKLPNEPTIYDYLVLALRPRDLIATFNWDPFLHEAYQRNYKIAELPGLAFLHGNVAIGYSAKDKRFGPARMTSKASLSYYEPTKLLYPIDKKDYHQDEFTQLAWQSVRGRLHSKSTHLVTIFGYGAPSTDVEAVKLLNDAWGTPDERDMEQFEIIDVRSEDQVREQWDNFIHSHHYNYSTDYFKSSLSINPRRTFESHYQHILPLTPSDMFSESNPISSDIKTMEELWDWHRNLIDAEKRAKMKSE